MKYYIWAIDYYTRSGAYGMTANGVLKADSEEDARDILWDKKGNEYAANLRVYPIDPDAKFIELNF